MNPDPLSKQLLAAARQAPERTDVPWGFEKRVMANLRTREVWDPLSLWSVGLWRAALGCSALAACLTLLNWASPDRVNTEDGGANRSDALEFWLTINFDSGTEIGGDSPW